MAGKGRKAVAYQNKQKEVEKEIRELLGKYSVLYKSQLYGFFAKDGRERFVGKALKALEKERYIYVQQEMDLVSVSSESIKARDRGTLLCIWALLGIMDKKKVGEHFHASADEYPVRIVFVGDGEIFDILYVPETDIGLTNHFFTRKKIDGCGHIIVVEKPENIPEIQVPDVVGFCIVKEGGAIEYYRKNE